MWKKVLATIAFMFLIFLIVCALLPSNYTVERSVLIQAPDSTVYTQVADFNQWPSWSAWAKRDPESINRFEGSPSTIGHSWYWKGEIVGEGQMTHIELIPNQKVVSKLEFFEPQAMIAENIMQLEKAPSGTRVKMIMNGSLGYPVERLFGLVIDDLIGPDFQEGLDALKAKIEGGE